MKRKVCLISIVALTGLLYTCSDLIEYSPYEVRGITTSINTTNAGIIARQTIPADTLRFGLISDTHSHYDDLADAITSINHQESIQFVVFCGDCTHRGLSQEYTWYSNIIGTCRYPVITVIGNHDLRSNGRKNFENIFGPANMSFTCMNYRFIVFDDIVWENNNKCPDFDWLQGELTKNNAPAILLTHLPPWNMQLEGNCCHAFSEIISVSNLILCIHGHEHKFSENSFAGVPAIVAGEITERNYCIVKVYDQLYEVHRICF